MFDPGRVKFLLLGLGRQSLIWVWKISPKNPKIFNFFPFRSKKSHLVGSKSTQVKDRLASYSLRVKSMLGLGQGPSLDWTLGISPDRLIIDNSKKTFFI